METPQDTPQEFIDLETAVTLFKKPKMTIWRAGKWLRIINMNTYGPLGYTV